MTTKAPSKVNGRYGAPMGRADQPNAYSEFRAIPDHPHKFSLVRVKLDNGGYDQGGAYWGHGQPLYWAEAGAVERWFRAKDRDAAKKTIREEFPDATFYR